MTSISLERSQAYRPGRPRVAGSRSEGKPLPDQVRTIAAAQEQIAIRQDKLRLLPKGNLERATLEAQIQAFVEGIRRVQWAYNLSVDID